MAATVARLEAILSADTDKFDRAIDRADKKTKHFGSSAGKAFKLMGVAAVAGGAAAVGGIGFAIKAASDLGEQVTKSGVVFGKNAKTVQSWSKGLTTSFGLSQRAAMEAAGTYGNMLKPLGIAPGMVSKMSMRMTELAGDMASFNNASPEETLLAIRSGLAGESEPLKRFGISLNDARLKQEALKLGLYSGKGALDAAAKAQAAYALILKDSKDAAGDFQETNKSLPNLMRTFKAETENAAASLGAVFLPLATKLVNWAAVLVPKLAELVGNLTEKLKPAFDRVGATIPSLVMHFRDIWSWINQNVIPVIRQLREIFVDAMAKIRATLDANGPELQRILGRIGEALKAIAKVAIPILRVAFVEVLPRAIGVAITIIDKFSYIVEKTVGVVRATANGIAVAFGKIKSTIQSVTKFAIDFFNAAKRLGSAMVDGVISGIKAAPGKVKDALIGVVGGAVDGAADFLLARSPSKLAEIRLGRPIPDGIVKGILSGKLRVSEALVDVAAKAVDAARSKVQSRFGEMANWLSYAFGKKQAGEQTLTEKLIGAKEAEREAARLVGAIQSAQAALNEAISGGDAASIASAQTALAEAEYQQWLANAQKKAALEREDLETRQWMEQQAFQKRLTILQGYLESGEATTKGATKRIKDLMGDFGVSAAEVTVMLGKGFASGLKKMIPGVAKAAAELRIAAENEGIILRGRTITVRLEETARKRRDDHGDAPGDAGGGGSQVPGGSLVGLGRWMQGLGYQVGEHPAFGGVGGGHAPNSFHYQGRAIDVNWPGGGGEEMRRLDWLHSRIASLPHAELLWRARDHFDHLHFAMDKGGVVPGFGPKLGILHGGETVLPTHKQNYGGNITINMPNYVGSKQEFLGWLKSAIAQDKRSGGLGFA